MVSVSKTYGSSFGRIGNTHSILNGTLKRLHKYVQDDSQTVTADDAIDIDAPYLKLKIKYLNFDLIKNKINFQISNSTYFIIIINNTIYYIYIHTYIHTYIYIYIYIYPSPPI